MGKVVLLWLLLIIALSFHFDCGNITLEGMTALTSFYCHLNLRNVFKIFAARAPWVSSGGLEFVVSVLLTKKKGDNGVFLPAVPWHCSLLFFFCIDLGEIV